MPSMESLKAKISSIEDLQSVVRTMKALAAVSIRQYEKAVESLGEYNRTIEMGLQIVLRERYFADKSILSSSIIANKPFFINRIGVIIFGSDQGLCGQFNEQIVSFAVAELDQLQINSENRLIAAVGARLIPHLEASGQSLLSPFSLPSSAKGITSIVQEVLLTIEQWRTQQQIDKLVLFYNKSLAGATYHPHTLNLLPVNPDWLQSLEQEAWNSPVLPTFTMDWQQLFSALIYQYLFISLYRACAESLASENASRLSSMQAAEKNIADRLAALNAEYRYQRQSTITAELLDIVAGFEALTESNP
ncbi:MAG: F0F1 ATP synthase subunit gamma [Nostocaceae cyanobacterium]|nr:F0F1 ATP synthase subunit gamma [Nostocaceae cyanobacterium]